MRQLFAIILITDRRDSGLYRRVGTEEQNTFAHEALCYPEIFFALSQILQGKEKLLVRVGQQVARRIAVVPAGSLQQSGKEIVLFLVFKDVGSADNSAVDALI